MKTLAIVTTLIVLALVGCNGMQVGTVFNQPCTIYETFGATPENSLIAAKITNPCAAQRLLATAAKLPAVWGQKEYIDKFNQWSGVIHSKIANGMTYSALQGLVVAEIAKFNKEAGLTLLIMSDSLLVFGTEESPMKPMDQKLLLASLNDLRVQVATLSLVAK